MILCTTSTAIEIDTVKAAVREVVREELTKLFLALTPEADEREMAELKQLLENIDEHEKETEGIDWLGE